MTRYEYILNLGDDFVKLIAFGLMPVHILNWKGYYETYLKNSISVERKSDVVTQTADQYKVSDRTIYSVIAFMEYKN